MEQKLLPIVWHLDTRPASESSKHYVHVAKLTFEKRGYQQGRIQEDAVVVGKVELVPLAFRLVRRRQPRPFWTGEAPYLRTPQDDKASLTCLEIFTGANDETAKVFFATTGNALDKTQAAKELKAVADAIAKIVYE